jgi:Ser/Thr protein kinase RdoA (MazF antagonist)
MFGSGLQPPFGGELEPLARRAWWHVEHRRGELVSLLSPWAGPRPVQPCICDVWNRHLLFEGDRLTGLVDYGEAKIDHVAVDLARLLGDLAGDDEAGWQTGLAAYRSLRPLTAEEERLARVLDRSGVVLGAAAWLRRLYLEGRRYDDMQAVSRRLGVLVTRMDRWE